MITLKNYLSKLVLEFFEIESYLNKLDEALTGKNFGTKIFSCVKDISKKIEHHSSDNINKIFVDISLSFVQNLSDKMGLVLASLAMRFWKYMGDNIYSKENICTNFYNAVKEIKNDFDLSLNLKSFFDILYVIAVNAHINRHERLDILFEKIKIKAQNSMDQIIKMKARADKARYLGKRSVGKICPKALAIYVSFLCLENLVKNEKNKKF